jgi:hypothetical protein
MSERVRQGIIIGLIMATGASLYVCVLFLLRGSEPFTNRETSLLTVVLTYYATGTIGGALVGKLSWLARFWFGKAVLASIASAIAFMCLTLAKHGPVWRWPASAWADIAVLAGIFGIGLGIVLRKA